MNSHATHRLTPAAASEQDPNDLPGLVAAPLPLQSGDIPGLVWAYHFDADGSASALDDPVDSALLSAVRTGGGWLWPHFSPSHARGREFIAAMDLPERAKAELLSNDDHPNLHLEGDTAFGLVVDWQHEIGNKAHELAGQSGLRFAPTDGLIVSGRLHPLHPLRSVEAVRELIDAGARLPSAGRVLEAIVEQFSASVAQSSAQMTDLAQDDARQSAIATRFLEQRLTAADRGFVSLVTLLETVSVMESRYGADAAPVVEILSDLLDAPTLEVQDAPTVRAALQF